MRTILGGLALVVLVGLGVVAPIWLAMIGLGILHDLHPAVPALGFVSVLWSLIITGIVGTFFHGNSFYKSSQ
jgi:hypothetical protein